MKKNKWETYKSIKTQVNDVLGKYGNTMKSMYNELGEQKKNGK